MKVSLFVPCYMNIAYPNAATSTQNLLEKLGIEVTYNKNQTCCGQMHANSGCKKDASKLVNKFIKDYQNDDANYIIVLSGGCKAMVKDTFPYYLKDSPLKEEYEKLKAKTFELCEFLIDVLNLTELPFKVSFPYNTSIHYNCHYLRHLEPLLASENTSKNKPESRVYKLLKLVDGIKLQTLKQRPDECCGFGGTFALKEDAISKQAGLDRLKHHVDASSQNIVFTDVSCKMHLEGLKNRHNINLNMYYIAEILTWKN